MLEKNKKDREQLEIVCTEMLVPQEHLLRKIDSADEAAEAGYLKPEAVFIDGTHIKAMQIPKRR